MLDSTATFAEVDARDREAALERALPQLEPEDRAVLTGEVLERWAEPLAPGDLTPDVLAEIAHAERQRRRSLQTLRREATLTELEVRLVHYLIRHAGRVRSYVQIAHHLWGSSTNPITARMLRSQFGYASPMVAHIQTLVYSIRRKLEIDALRPMHLATARGIGYVWYELPPSFDDQIDYAARDRQFKLDRERMAELLGVIPDDSLDPKLPAAEDDPSLPGHWEPDAPLTGPNLPVRPPRRQAAG